MTKIIAVDFDGTLCATDSYPEIGEPNEELILYLRRKQDAGHKIILWTCRVGQELKDAVKWCSKHNLIFDAVNENLPEVIEYFGSDSRKIFANEYIDDRNVWYPEKENDDLCVAINSRMLFRTSYDDMLYQPSQFSSMWNGHNIERNCIISNLLRFLEDGEINK